MKTPARMPITSGDAGHIAANQPTRILFAVVPKGAPVPDRRFTECCAGILLLPAISLGLAAAAQPFAPAIPRTTVVVFADRPMSSVQWAALVFKVRAEIVEDNPETQALDRNAEFIRGDRLLPGLLVDSAISVYLHGDCTLSPLPRRIAYGEPLGWVRRVDGRVQPFVHVDCTRIDQVIGPQALWLSAERRIDVMAGAIARVIVHEWIHIATQSRKHADCGIAKAEFGVADLMGNVRPIYWPRTGQ